MTDTRHRERRRWRTAEMARSGVCHYCGRPLTGRSATVDHRVPRSHGGADIPKNWRLCCERCNRAKGSTAPEEWESVERLPAWEIGAREATLRVRGLHARVWRQGRRGSTWAWRVGEAGADGLSGRMEAVRCSEAEVWRQLRERRP